MSFRRRLVLLCALAVAGTVTIASGLTYVLVRDSLRSQVDNSLRGLVAGARVSDAHIQTAQPERPPNNGRPGRPDPDDVSHSVLRLPPAVFGGYGAYGQLVTTSGHVLQQPGANPTVQLPVSKRVLGVTSGKAPAYFYDATIRGNHLRMYVAPLAPGRALQSARSLNEVNEALRKLAIILGLVALGGIAFAAFLALGVARAAAVPLRRMSRTAQTVARTDNLSGRVDAVGDDELAQLATSFNGMLDALQRSRHTQQQLIADASHELRTPLTSVMANVEMLDRADEMPPHDLALLRQDISAQLEELRNLINGLIHLAREEDAIQSPAEPIAFHEVVAACVARLTTPGSDVHFATWLEPWIVTGYADALDRAVSCLLDNARKFSPKGGTVTVTLHNGELIVSDEGPGIASEDLPFVFDRFYRARDARPLPGSGIGLAIVQQVAKSHQGRAWAAPAVTSGAELHLQLPGEATFLASSAAL